KYRVNIPLFVILVLLFKSLLYFICILPSGWYGFLTLIPVIPPTTFLWTAVMPSYKVDVHKNIPIRKLLHNTKILSRVVRNSRFTRCEHSLPIDIENLM